MSRADLCPSETRQLITPRFSLLLLWRPKKRHCQGTVLYGIIDRLSRLSFLLFNNLSFLVSRFRALDSDLQTRLRRCRIMKIDLKCTRAIRITQIKSVINVKIKRFLRAQRASTCSTQINKKTSTSSVTKKKQEREGLLLLSILCVTSDGRYCDSEFWQYNFTRSNSFTGIFFQLRKKIARAKISYCGILMNQ